jgi:hypothetical protein
MIQKMSDANKISFMDIKKEESPVISPISNKENYMPKAKKLSSRDNGMKTDQHICSARTGVISDTGGPTKYTKAESSNTVWDTSKISRSSNELKKEAKNIEKNVQQEQLSKEENKISESKILKEESTPAFSRLSDLGGSTYHAPSTGMSIFDNKDFQRLAEKTQGEAMSEELNKKRNLKDDSWKNNGKMLTSKDIANNLINKLFKK